MSETDPEPKSRKRGVRWRRVAGWLALLGISGVTALGVAGGWGYKNRTQLANWILRQTFSEFHAQLGDLQMSRQGIDITDLTVHDPKSGAAIATIRSIMWCPDWAKMAAGNIGRITLSGAKLDVSAEQFRSWTVARATEEPSRKAPSGFRLTSLALESAELRDVSVNVRGDAEAPSFSFRMEHSLRGLDISDLDRPRLDEATLKVTDLVITQRDGEKPTVPELTVTAGLRETDGMIEIKTAFLRGARVRVTPLFRDWVKRMTTSDISKPAASLDLPWFKGVALKKLDIEDCEFHADGDVLPMQGGMHLSYRISDLEWRIGMPLKLGDHRMELTDLTLRPQQGPGSIRVPKLSVEMNDVDPAKGWVLDRCVLNQASIEWTQALEDVFVRPASPAPLLSQPPKSQTTTAPLLITALSFRDASLQFQSTKLCPLVGRLGLGVELQQVTIAPDRITADNAQKLRLKDVSLAWQQKNGSAAEPFATLAAADLEINPAEWSRASRIDKLVITKPEIKLTEKTARWMKPPAAPQKGTKPAAATAPAQAQASEPFWQKINFGQLEVSGGQFQYATSGTGRVEASTEFSVSTEPAPDQDTAAPLHRLRLTNARGMIPDVAKLPVAGIELFEAVVRLPNVWRDKHVESLQIKGGQIEAGEALMSLFVPGESTQIKPLTAALAVPIAQPPVPTPPPSIPAVEMKAASASTTSAKRWTTGSIQLGDVAVTLQKIAPGLPPVRFVVNIQAQDTPLEPEALAKHVVKQRVELSNLIIPSTLNPLRTVARLDTIFVDFTLEGLFAQRIDKVEMVSPTLFVGEDLFWYVEYFRKYAEPEPKVPAAAPAPVTNETAPAAAATEISILPEKKKAWTVGAVQVHAGKLVLAPKGVPLSGGFGKPFPFGFVTRMDEGRFDATLDIPPDTYTIPDIKVEFRGLKGHVQFNLPIKGVDNNLTEVFRAEQIRWKDLHIDDAHLSVTYDANGIYGQFGGSAYEGYLGGAFNVYLDQMYTWDGWIATTGVRTTEITQKLCPAYFLLDGKVDGKVVATGNAEELYQADLGFKNVTPGTFSVAGLNDMIRDCGKVGSADVTSQIMRIGLETLRDFDYESVNGEGRFYGREGKGFLRFKGPAGERNFDINVFDHRWKDDRKSVTQKADGDE